MSRREAHFLRGELGLVRGLYRWGRSVVRAAEQSPKLFEENRHVREGVRRELNERLGEALASTRVSPPRDAELTRVNHSRLVKKAQDYALEHIDERIHLTDLCQAMRVSERTLRYAFRNVLDMSPVAYLSRLRLHRVHKSPQRGDTQLDHGHYRSTSLGLLARRRFLESVQRVFR